MSELFRELTKRPEWQQRAACRGQGHELWFTESRAAEAKALCAVCRCAEECAAFAAESDASLQGVWGGLDRRDRAALRRDQREVDAA